MPRSYDAPEMTKDVTTTTQALAAWLKWARAGGLSELSVVAYRPLIQDFFITEGVEHYDAEPHHFVDWSERLAKRGATVPHMGYRACQNFWKFLRANGLTDKNPVEFMPFTPPAQKVPDAFSKQQLDVIWEAATKLKPSAELVLKFLYFTGARRSEAISVRLEDLDDFGVTLKHVKTRPGGVAKERRVPFGPDALQIVRRSRDEINRSDRRVFPYCYRTLNVWCSHITGEVGFHVHPHKFRATFATTLLTRGVDIRTVQELLGHAEVSTTMRYLAVTDERKLQAVARL